jgi:hypothetical protein
MSINKYALLAICEILEHERADAEVERLRQVISERGFLAFDYSKSPLRHLEAGFKAIDRNYYERFAPVFRTLQVPPKEPEGSEVRWVSSNDQSPIS